MATLKEEITQPGYVGLSDAEIAARLNAPAGKAATRTNAEKDAVIVLAQDIVLAIAGASDAVRTKWQTLILPLVTLVSGVTGTFVRANVTALDAAVADGLITAEQANAPWSKTNASRAEELFGADTIITEAEVGEARNG